MQRVVFAGLVGLIACGVAKAQSCGHWSDGYAVNGLGGRIQASVMFDDGTGPALYVAGEFRNDAAAPGRQGIAKWNGTSYVPVGGGLDGPAWAMEVFDDDGAGPHAPALYVAGHFAHAGGVGANSIARWDGTSWSALGQVPDGVDGTVYALKSHDDGGGPGLYVGGSFVSAGGGGASSLALWRGGQWSNVGGGVTLFSSEGIVNAMESFQGGLYVGGFFDHAAGVTTNAIVKWSGGAWSNLGTGINYGGSSAQVDRLLAVNLASTGGPALIVAGTLSSAGGGASGPIVRWNGSVWSTMNSGAGSSSSYPDALGVFDDGTGAALYAGAVLPGGSGISKWNGTAWTLVGAVPFTQGVPLGVDTMTSVPGAGGGRLFVGGMFRQIAGGAPPCAASLRNGQWSAADSYGLGSDSRINAMGVYDLGDGPHLYAGGLFAEIGGALAAGVARLGTNGWEAVATSIASDATPTIRTLAAFNDGTGMALYVGGAFSAINGVTASNVARWRPVGGWSAAGAGLSFASTATTGTVYALCVHDDDGPGPHAPALYATGQIQFSGAASITGVARWNGAAWQSVGLGPAPGGVTGACLASIDLDGPGGQPPRLYWGGVLSPITVWDGTSWTQDMNSPSATVLSFIGAFDLGSGLQVYAGGDFTAPFSGSVARKTAAGTWEQVGASPRFPNGGGSGGVVENGSVQAMAMFDDGGGPQLYITGIFGSLFSNGYMNAARWNGSAWTGVGAGLASRFPGTDGRGSSLAVFDDRHGGGPALYFGGKFERVYPTGDTALNSWHAAYNITRWTGCPPPSTCCADFNGDGDPRTDADIEAFFACIAGNCCATCCSADYNGDGDTATDADIESFFRVLAGGNC